MTDSRKITLDEFIRRSREKHGDKFDYSLITDYERAESRVKIRCVEHDHVFETNGNQHYGGANGCVFCEGTTTRHTTETFIKKSRMVHGDRFDYSEVEYVNNRTHVKIYCKEHDHWFTQPPKKHMIGRVGCAFCSHTKGYSHDDYLRVAKEKWGDRWDYSFVKYKRANDLIKIRCKEHDLVFETSGWSHLNHVSCPLCKTNGKSEQEQEVVSFISSLGVEYQNNQYFTVDGVRREFDIVLPDHKLMIEYNGNYWHSHSQKDNNYHKEKMLLADKLGYTCLFVWEHQWTDPVKRSIIKRLLSNKIKGNASTTPLNKVVHTCQSTPRSVKEFIDKNHIHSGSVGSDLTYFTLNGDDIESVMCLQHSGNNVYHLSAFCSTVHNEIEFKLLLDKFKSDHPDTEIFAECDDQLFSGNTYCENGFILIAELEPDYHYIHNNRVGTLHRSMWESNKINERCKELGLEIEPPDYNNEDDLLKFYKRYNVNRLYDCGRSLWVLQN
jgi:G:T-mismatch repair DNA endonuclease (very short patch repair protein)